MNKEAQLEIIAHALRWANNMVIEVVGNHHSNLSTHTRIKLRAACTALMAAMDAVRDEQLGNPNRDV